MRKNPTSISFTSSKNTLITSSVFALFAIGLFQLNASSLLSIESVLILFGVCNLLGAFAFFYYQRSRMISFFLLISFFSFFIVERSLYFERQNETKKATMSYPKSVSNKVQTIKP